MTRRNRGGGGNQRMEALRSLLFWEGEIGRGRVVELFAVSATRASEWVREFREAYPSWTRWDPRERAFIATAIAYKDLSEAARAQLLADYVGLTGVEIARKATRQVAVRAFGDFIAPSPQVFSTLRRGIVGACAVDITYGSMRDPNLHEHRIEPHTLALAGPRWHVRAYSLTRGEYRDFALGRIGACALTGEASSHGSNDDAAWQASVAVTLGAHPALTPDQQDLVRREYFGGAVQRVETTRGALVPYLLQEMRVAIHVDRQLPPDYILAVTNTKAVRPWLFPT